MTQIELHEQARDAEVLFETHLREDRFGGWLIPALAVAGCVLGFDFWDPVST